MRKGDIVSIKSSGVKMIVFSVSSFYNPFDWNKIKRYKLAGLKNTLNTHGGTYFGHEIEKVN